jgi:hypothetical protein
MKPVFQSTIELLIAVKSGVQFAPNEEEQDNDKEFVRL